MVFDYWPLVEADFAEHYGELDPLGLGWRKFKALLAALPGQSRVHMLLRDESTHWSEKLAVMKGRKRPHTGTISQIPGGAIIRG